MSKFKSGDRVRVLSGVSGSDFSLNLSVGSEFFVGYVDYDGFVVYGNLNQWGAHEEWCAYEDLELINKVTSIKIKLRKLKDFLIKIIKGI